MKRFEDIQDVMAYWCEMEHQVVSEAWQEFKDGINIIQGWQLMDEVKFVQLVRKAFNGVLTDSDRELIDEYCELIFYNWIKLDFNTIMVGHSRWDPLVHIQEKLDDASITQEQIDNYCDWVEGDAYSDYGLEPIAKMLTPLMLQQNYSLKVQIMAEIIGVIHMRGDLSRFFVTGGRHTHAQIDCYESTCY